MHDFNHKLVPRTGVLLLGQRTTWVDLSFERRSINVSVTLLQTFFLEIFHLDMTSNREKSLKARFFAGKTYRETLRPKRKATTQMGVFE